MVVHAKWGSRSWKRVARRSAFAGAAVAVLTGADAFAGPQGEQVVAGSASVSRGTSSTVVNQHSQNAVINWRQFNVAGSETVQFVQPNSMARILNRITGADPSTIDGNIQANGQVYIVNPAGVVFGPNSVVNVGSLYAAAGDITNQNFMNGVDDFHTLSGTVSNYGTITADQVHLMGGRVENFGSIITSPGGLVSMSAGDRAYIAEESGHWMVQVSGGNAGAAAGADAGVGQHGSIETDGGNVSLGAGDMFALAIHNTGSVSGNSINVAGGSGNGSQVVNDGTLDASNAGGQGGSVVISGQNVVQAGIIDTSGAIGGDVIINSTDSATLADGSQTLAQGGGNVLVNSPVDGEQVSGLGAMEIGAIIDTTGGADDGFVELSGYNLNVQGAFTGGLATGTILFDPANITIVDQSEGLQANDGDLPTINDSDGAGTWFVGELALESALDSSNVLLEATGNITINPLVTDGVLDGTNGGAGGTLTITSTGAGNFNMSDTDEIQLDSDLIITVNGGNITTLGIVDTNGGNIVARASGPVSLQGAINTDGGNITIAGGQTITVINPVVTDNGDITVQAFDPTDTIFAGTASTLGSDFVQILDGSVNQLDAGTGTILVGGTDVNAVTQSGNVIVGEAVPSAGLFQVTTNGDILDDGNVLTGLSGTDVLLEALGANSVIGSFAEPVGVDTTAGTITARTEFANDGFGQIHLVEIDVSGNGNPGDFDVDLDNFTLITNTAHDKLVSIHVIPDDSSDQNGIDLDSVVDYSDQNIDLALVADYVNIGAQLNIDGADGDNDLYIMPISANEDIAIGAELAGHLSLTDAELDNIVAENLIVGRQEAGRVFVNSDGAIEPNNITGNWTIIAGDAITDDGDATADILTLSTGGTLTLDSGQGIEGVEGTDIDPDAGGAVWLPNKLQVASTGAIAARSRDSGDVRIYEDGDMLLDTAQEVADPTNRFGGAVLAGEFGAHVDGADNVVLESSGRIDNSNVDSAENGIEGVAADEDAAFYAADGIGTDGAPIVTDIGGDLAALNTANGGIFVTESFDGGSLTIGDANINLAGTEVLNGITNRAAEGDADGDVEVMTTNGDLRVNSGFWVDNDAATGQGITLGAGSDGSLNSVLLLSDASFVFTNNGDINLFGNEININGLSVVSTVSVDTPATDGLLGTGAGGTNNSGAAGGDVYLSNASDNTTIDLGNGADPFELNISQAELRRILTAGSFNSDDADNDNEDAGTQRGPIIGYLGDATTTAQSQRNVAGITIDTNVDLSGGDNSGNTGLTYAIDEAYANNLALITDGAITDETNGLGGNLLTANQFYFEAGGNIDVRFDLVDETLDNTDNNFVAAHTTDGHIVLEHDDINADTEIMVIQEGALFFNRGDTGFASAAPGISVESGTGNIIVIASDNGLVHHQDGDIENSGMGDIVVEVTTDEGQLDLDGDFVTNGGAVHLTADEIDINTTFAQFFVASGFNIYVTAHEVIDAIYLGTNVGTTAGDENDLNELELSEGELRRLVTTGDDAALVIGMAARATDGADDYTVEDAEIISNINTGGIFTDDGDTVVTGGGENGGSDNFTLVSNGGLDGGNGYLEIDGALTLDIVGSIDGDAGTDVVGFGFRSGTIAARTTRTGVSSLIQLSRDTGDVTLGDPVQAVDAHGGTAWSQALIDGGNPDGGGSLVEIEAEDGIITFDPTAGSVASTTGAAAGNLELEFTVYAGFSNDNFNVNIIDSGSGGLTIHWDPTRDDAVGIESQIELRINLGGSGATTQTVADAVNDYLNGRAEEIPLIATATANTLTVEEETFNFTDGIDHVVGSEIALYGDEGIGLALSRGAGTAYLPILVAAGSADGEGVAAEADDAAGTLGIHLAHAQGGYGGNDLRIEEIVGTNNLDGIFNATSGDTVIQNFSSGFDEDFLLDAAIENTAAGTEIRIVSYDGTGFSSLTAVSSAAEIVTNNGDIYLIVERMDIGAANDNSFHTDETSSGGSIFIRPVQLDRPINLGSAVHSSASFDLTEDEIQTFNVNAADALVIGTDDPTLTDANAVDSLFQTANGRDIISSRISIESNVDWTTGDGQNMVLVTGSDHAQAIFDGTIGLGGNELIFNAAAPGGSLSLMARGGIDVTTNVSQIAASSDLMVGGIGTTVATDAVGANGDIIIDQGNRSPFAIADLTSLPGGVAGLDADLVGSIVLQADTPGAVTITGAAPVTPGETGFIVIELTDVLGELHIDAPLSTTNGEIHLIADDFDITADINPGTDGTNDVYSVYVDTFTPGLAVDLGAAGVGGAVLSTAELQHFVGIGSGNALVIGNATTAVDASDGFIDAVNSTNAGDLTLLAAVDLTGGSFADNVTLISGGNLTSSADTFALIIDGRLTLDINGGISGTAGSLNNALPFHAGSIAARSRSGSDISLFADELVDFTDHISLGTPLEASSAWGDAIIDTTGDVYLEVQDGEHLQNDLSPLAARVELADDLIVTASSAGAEGNALNVEIIDSATGGLSVSVTGNTVVVDLGGDTVTNNDVATAIEAETGLVDVVGGARTAVVIGQSSLTGGVEASGRALQVLNDNQLVLSAAEAGTDPNNVQVVIVDDVTPGVTVNDDTGTSGNVIITVTADLTGGATTQDVADAINGDATAALFVEAFGNSEAAVANGGVNLAGGRDGIAADALHIGSEGNSRLGTAAEPIHTQVNTLSIAIDDLNVLGSSQDEIAIYESRLGGDLSLANPLNNGFADIGESISIEDAGTLGSLPIDIRTAAGDLTVVDAIDVNNGLAEVGQLRLQAGVDIDSDVAEQLGGAPDNLVFSDGGVGEGHLLTVNAQVDTNQGEVILRGDNLELNDIVSVDSGGYIYVLPSDTQNVEIELSGLAGAVGDDNAGGDNLLNINQLEMRRLDGADLNWFGTQENTFADRDEGDTMVGRIFLTDSSTLDADSDRIALVTRNNSNDASSATGQAIDDDPTAAQGLGGNAFNSIEALVVDSFGTSDMSWQNPGTTLQFAGISRQDDAVTGDGGDIVLDGVGSGLLQITEIGNASEYVGITTNSDVDPDATPENHQANVVINNSDGDIEVLEQVIANSTGYIVLQVGSADAIDINDDAVNGRNLVTTNAGDIHLITDNIDVEGDDYVLAGTGAPNDHSVYIRTFTATHDIEVGDTAADGLTTLGLNETEILNLRTEGAGGLTDALVIGRATTAADAADDDDSDTFAEITDPLLTNTGDILITGQIDAGSLTDDVYNITLVTTGGDILNTGGATAIVTIDGILTLDAAGDIGDIDGGLGQDASTDFTAGSLDNWFDGSGGVDNDPILVATGDNDYAGVAARSTSGEVSIAMLATAKTSETFNITTGVEASRTVEGVGTGSMDHIALWVDPWNQSYYDNAVNGHVVLLDIDQPIYTDGGDILIDAGVGAGSDGADATIGGVIEMGQNFVTAAFADLQSGSDVAGDNGDSAAGGSAINQDSTGDITTSDATVYVIAGDDDDTDSDTMEDNDLEFEIGLIENPGGTVIVAFDGNVVDNNGGSLNIDTNVLILNNAPEFNDAFGVGGDEIELAISGFSADVGALSISNNQSLEIIDPNLDGDNNPETWDEDAPGDPADNALGVRTRIGGVRINTGVNNLIVNGVIMARSDDTFFPNVEDQNAPVPGANIELIADTMEINASVISGRHVDGVGGDITLSPLTLTQDINIAHDPNDAPGGLDIEQRELNFLFAAPGGTLSIGLQGGTGEVNIGYQGDGDGDVFFDRQVSDLDDLLDDGANPIVYDPAQDPVTDFDNYRMVLGDRNGDLVVDNDDFVQGPIDDPYRFSLSDSHVDAAGYAADTQVEAERPNVTIFGGNTFFNQSARYYTGQTFTLELTGAVIDNNDDGAGDATDADIYSWNKGDLTQFDDDLGADSNGSVVITARASEVGGITYGIGGDYINDPSSDIDLAVSSVEGLLNAGAPGVGHISITNVGALTNQGMQNLDGGNIVVIADSPQTIAGDQIALGDGSIILVASEDGDVLTEDDLTINDNVTIKSDTGSIGLFAGDNILADGTFMQIVTGGAGEIILAADVDASVNLSGGGTFTFNDGTPSAGTINLDADATRNDTSIINQTGVGEILLVAQAGITTPQNIIAQGGFVELDTVSGPINAFGTISGGDGVLFSDNVTVVADLEVTSQFDDVTFTGAIDGPGGLTVFARSGTASFQGVGQVVPLDFFTVDASVVDLPGDVTTVNDISIESNNDIEIDGTLTSTSGVIVLDSGDEIDVDGLLVAPSVALFANDGIFANTDVDALTAVNSGSGSIFINETDGLTIGFDYDGSGTIDRDEGIAANGFGIVDVNVAAGDLNLVGGDLVGILVDLTTSAGDIVINADATAAVNEISNPNGNFVLNASGNIELEDALAAEDDIEFNAPVIITGDATVESTDGSVLYTGTINNSAAGDLTTIAEDGEVVLADDVNLDGSFSVDADNAVLEDNITISTNGGDIDFDRTPINSDGSTERDLLLIAGAGNVTLAGGAGNDEELGSVTIFSSGTTSLAGEFVVDVEFDLSDADDIDLVGDVLIRNTVDDIGDAVAVTLDNDGGTLNGDFDLTIDVGDNGAANLGDVGSLASPINSLTVIASSTTFGAFLNGDIYTESGQDFSQVGQITLLSNVTLNNDGSGVIDLTADDLDAAAAGVQTLVIDGNSTNIELGPIGQSAELGGLTVSTTGTTGLVGDIDTAGIIDFSATRRVELRSSIVIDSTDADILFHADGSPVNNTLDGQGNALWLDAGPSGEIHLGQLRDLGPAGGDFANGLTVEDFDVADGRGADLLQLHGSALSVVGMELRANTVIFDGQIEDFTNVTVDAGRIEINASITVSGNDSIDLVADGVGVAAGDGDIIVGGGIRSEFGDISLTAEDDIEIIDGLVVSDSGDIQIVAVTGDVSFNNGLVTSGIGDIDIEATAGQIVEIVDDSGDLDIDIAGNVINLNAANGIGVGASGPIEVDARQRLNASTTNADILITDLVGDMPIGTVDAGTANVSLTAAAGSITDALIGGGANVIADTLTAEAQNDIDLVTTIVTLNAETLAEGNIDIFETDAIVLSDIETADGDIDISATDITVSNNSVNANLGDVQLVARTGGINTTDDDLVWDIRGSDIVLEAVTGINVDTQTTGSSITASTTGDDGDIDIDNITTVDTDVTLSTTGDNADISFEQTDANGAGAFTGDLTVLSATTVDGDITLLLVDGDLLTAAEVIAGGDAADSNDVVITTLDPQGGVGEIALGLVSASNDDVSLTAVGPISAANGAAENVRADELGIFGATQVGDSADYIDTNVNTLRVQSAAQVTGDVFIRELNTVTQGVGDDGIRLNPIDIAGDLHLNSGGNIEVFDVNVNGNDVFLQASTSIIDDGDAGTDISANVLNILGASAVGATATDANTTDATWLDTDVDTLNVSGVTYAGGIYILEDDSITLGTVDIAVDEDVDFAVHTQDASGGDILVGFVNVDEGTVTLDTLGAGGAIEDAQDDDANPNSGIDIIAGEVDLDADAGIGTSGRRIEMSTPLFDADTTGTNAHIVLLNDTNETAEGTTLTTTGDDSDIDVTQVGGDLLLSGATTATGDIDIVAADESVTFEGDVNAGGSIEVTAGTGIVVDANIMDAGTFMTLTANTEDIILDNAGMGVTLEATGDLTLSTPLGVTRIVGDSILYTLTTIDADAVDATDGNIVTDDILLPLNGTNSPDLDVRADGFVHLGNVVLGEESEINILGDIIGDATNQAGGFATGTPTIEVDSVVGGTILISGDPSDLPSNDIIQINGDVIGTGNVSINNAFSVVVTDDALIMAGGILDVQTGLPAYAGSDLIGDPIDTQDGAVAGIFITADDDSVVTFESNRDDSGTDDLSVLLTDISVSNGQDNDILVRVISEGGADIGVLDLTFAADFFGEIDSDEPGGGDLNEAVGRIGNGTIAINSGNVVTLVGYTDDVWVLNGTVDVNELIVDGGELGDGSGGLVIGGDITTADSQVYNTPILLVADVTLTSTEGDIIFNDTIDSAYDNLNPALSDGFELTVNTPATQNTPFFNAAGDNAFFGEVGGDNWDFAAADYNEDGVVNLLDEADPEGLEILHTDDEADITPVGDTFIGANIHTQGGTQNYFDSVHLTADVVLTDIGTTGIFFHGDIDSDQLNTSWGLALIVTDGGAVIGIGDEASDRVGFFSSLGTILINDVDSIDDVNQGNVVLVNNLTVGIETPDSGVTFIHGQNGSETRIVSGNIETTGNIEIYNDTVLESDVVIDTTAAQNAFNFGEGSQGDVLFAGMLNSDSGADADDINAGGARRDLTITAGEGSVTFGLLFDSAADADPNAGGDVNVHDDIVGGEVALDVIEILTDIETNDIPTNVMFNDSVGVATLNGIDNTLNTADAGAAVIYVENATGTVTFVDDVVVDSDTDNAEYEGVALDINVNSDNDIAIQFTDALDNGAVLVTRADVADAGGTTTLTNNGDDSDDAGDGALLIDDGYKFYLTGDFAQDGDGFVFTGADIYTDDDSVSFASPVVLIDNDDESLGFANDDNRIEIDTDANLLAAGGFGTNGLGGDVTFGDIVVSTDDDQITIEGVDLTFANTGNEQDFLYINAADGDVTFLGDAGDADNNQAGDSAQLQGLEIETANNVTLEDVLTEEDGVLIGDALGANDEIIGTVTLNGNIRTDQTDDGSGVAGNIIISGDTGIILSNDEGEVVGTTQDSGDNRTTVFDTNIEGGANDDGSVDVYDAVDADSENDFDEFFFIDAGNDDVTFLTNVAHIGSGNAGGEQVYGLHIIRADDVELNDVYTEEGGIELGDFAGNVPLLGTVTLQGDFFTDQIEGEVDNGDVVAGDETTFLTGGDILISATGGVVLSDSRGSGETLFDTSTGSADFPAGDVIIGDPDINSNNPETKVNADATLPGLDESFRIVAGNGNVSINDDMGNTNALQAFLVDSANSVSIRSIETEEGGIRIGTNGSRIDNGIFLRGPVISTDQGEVDNDTDSLLAGDINFWGPVVFDSGVDDQFVDNQFTIDTDVAAVSGDGDVNFWSTTDGTIRRRENVRFIAGGGGGDGNIFFEQAVGQGGLNAGLGHVRVSSVNNFRADEDFIAHSLRIGDAATHPGDTRATGSVYIGQSDPTPSSFLDTSGNFGEVGGDVVINSVDEIVIANIRTDGGYDNAPSGQDAGDVYLTTSGSDFGDDGNADIVLNDAGGDGRALISAVGGGGGGGAATGGDGGDVYIATDILDDPMADSGVNGGDIYVGDINTSGGASDDGVGGGDAGDITLIADVDSTNNGLIFIPDGQTFIHGDLTAAGGVDSAGGPLGEAGTIYLGVDNDRGFNGRAEIPGIATFIGEDADGVMIIETTGFSGTGGFIMGQHEKLTVTGDRNFPDRGFDGSLFIRSNGGDITVGDLVVDGTLNFNGNTVREVGPADVRADLTFNTRNIGRILNADGTISQDGGVDIIVAGRLIARGVNFLTPRSDDGAGNLQPQFALIDPRNASDNIVRRYVVRQLNVQFLPIDLGGNTVLDLRASGPSVTSVAESIADPLLIDPFIFKVLDQPVLSPTMQEELAALDMAVSDLSGDELLRFLVGRSIYDDLDGAVTADRIDFDLATEILEVYRELFVAEQYNDETGDTTVVERRGEIASILSQAYADYTSQVGAFDPLAFRQFVESSGNEEALAVLNQLRHLFDLLHASGLNDYEVMLAANAIYRGIVPEGLSQDQLHAAVIAVTPEPDDVEFDEVQPMEDQTDMTEGEGEAPPEEAM